MTGRIARAAAVVVAAVALAGACSDGGSTAAPRGTGTPTPSMTRATPFPLPSTTLQLPPPPRGGFDPSVQVTFDGAPTLTVEVARRPDQRARGLMQRTELAPNAGMIFVFPEPGRGGFYMLGTLIPLSIAYIDGGRVVSTAEMTPCPGQQCPTYAPAGDYTMAVEAPAGFFPRWRVRAGTGVRITGRITPPE